MTIGKNGDNGAAEESSGAPGEYASPPCYAHELDPAYEGIDEKPVDAKDWVSVHTWRKWQRSRLDAQRRSLSETERRRAADAIVQTIEKEFRLQQNTFAIYWPLPGEPDLRPLLGNLADGDAHAALPVIVAKNQPLEFWRWSSQTEMTTSGLWGIPAPAKRDVVAPSIIFVPLLGFDDECHRLGYGGGYYDRTLAAVGPQLVTVGIGYEFGRLPTIYPQSHDIAMHAIVTERGIVWNPLRTRQAR